MDDATERALRDDWVLPAAEVAEHHALVLFAIHQQSVRTPVHRRGQDLGHALRALRGADKFSEEAVDRRVYSLLTAESTAELLHHLSGLIRQLRSLPNVPGLDYDQIERDLAAWEWPDRRDRVRRRWGRLYHAKARSKPDDSTADGDAASP